jgi:hypothetical protein
MLSLEKRKKLKRMLKKRPNQSLNQRKRKPKPRKNQKLNSLRFKLIPVLVEKQREMPS